MAISRINTIEQPANETPESRIAPVDPKDIGRLPIEQQLEVLNVDESVSRMLIAEHQSGGELPISHIDASRLKYRELQHDRIEKAREHGTIRKIGTIASAYIELGADRLLQGPIPKDRRLKK